jgi:tRNA (cytidine/uridine-2'-O-)-methyltransferase
MLSSENEVFHPLFHVVLVEPEIPQNTGNIGRTCVGMNSFLHLVGPLGFEITHSRLKRAGLDYWPHLHWRYYDNLDQWQKQFRQTGRRYYFSAFATKPLYAAKFEKGDVLIFGKETAGLPRELLEQDPESNLLIPILGPVRGYNLATSVAVALSEAYRQISYGLSTTS